MLTYLLAHNSNVFGHPRDPDGAYAVVIPKWTPSMIKEETVFINGDGEISHDFCYIDNTVKSNISAATTKNEDATNQVCNVAVGERTTLIELFNAIKSALRDNNVSYEQQPTYLEFRPGDFLHSQANVSKAKSLLGYIPRFNISQGINQAMPWYVSSLNSKI